MMKKRLFLAGGTLGFLLLATGCAHRDRYGDGIVAMAVLSASSGSTVGGTVNFIREKDGLQVQANFGGLTPGLHGFHIHEKGDCTAPDAKSAGGHFNPSAMHHAGPTDPGRHLGDLGNLEADANGNATYSRTFPDLKLKGATSIIGKSVIIHAKSDDFTTQPSGNSGDRVACGIIVKR